jgi:asparagine synthase (glutamine-hydrolysing)
VFGWLGAVYPKADWAPRPLRAKTTLLSLAGDAAQGYARAIGFTPPELRDSFYSDDFRRLRGDYRAEAPMLELMRRAPARSGLDQAQYADLKFWLPGDILTKVDRTSMAVGLEAREPLLDHRLIEFAATLPEAMRVRGGQGKWLMKRTMRRFLPDEILYRPKQGFVTPIAQWFRGPLAQLARDICASARLTRTGWFDSRRLTGLVDAHLSGTSDNSRLLWQLFMLERSFTKLGIA